ncbi:ABC transporter ATP-binding protein [Hymenobacter nivis]|uniref:ABC transporter ATP-binding protein n=1 Tax=Hymenobacter nivis TaxID=1850093 RepID=A0A502HFY2_9BACT|nr:ABC transporter ATP-binding protein [Hymenobacter nivis]TPG72266.1 ABC transporter ATP-binding protein [Hymenobacter nivis]
MSDIAIKVENLSKLYRLGEVGTGTMSQDLNRWWASVRGKEDPFATVGETNDRTSKGNSDFVWSLKDINFEVKKGEVLGIIGRNGAGKSTLLKILSKITAPTTGKIKVNGRIASLLEVGTGFHPELTGRENIFLNGAILGMTKTEIRSKFDEIVDFSGVERYIDTPVKRYSSGMYVRLAFAVSAFLEPEVLIVDEVLAVGDAEFQKKCLGRMKDVSVNDGRTVLFVSHNMAAIQKLCTSGLFLQNGTVLANEGIDPIVDMYLANNFYNGNSVILEPKTGQSASIIKVEIIDEDGESVYEIAIGKKWIVKLTFQVDKVIKGMVSSIGIVSPADISICTSWQEPMDFVPGVYCSEFKQNDVQFAAGKYRVFVALSIGGTQNIQFLEDVASFNIIPVIKSADATVVSYDASTGIVLNQLQMVTYPVC